MAQVDLTTILTATPLIFILSDFTVQPYFRMTQKTKYFKNAQKYLANHTELRKRMIEELEDQDKKPLFNGYYFPDNVPFQMVMIINQVSKTEHKCDIDNLVKSVLDGAQGLIFKNDRFCDSIYVQRYTNLRNYDYIELGFSLMVEDPLTIIDLFDDMR